MFNTTQNPFTFFQTILEDKDVQALNAKAAAFTMDLFNSEKKLADEFLKIQNPQELNAWIQHSVQTQQEVFHKTAEFLPPFIQEQIQLIQNNFTKFTPNTKVKTK